MTDSTDVPLGSGILPDLLAALDPDPLTGQVLRPIQSAMETFSCPTAARRSQSGRLGKSTLLG